MYPDISDPINTKLKDEDIKLFELLFEGSFEGLKELSPWKNYFDAYVAFSTPFRRENLCVLIKGLSHNIKNFSDFEMKYRNHSDKRLIQQIIDDALTSQSPVGTLSLAQYVLTKVQNNENISHKDITMLEILKELNDFDIKNFLVTFKYSDLRSYTAPNSIDKLMEMGLNPSSIKLSHNKFRSLYLIEVENFFGSLGGNIAYSNVATELYDFFKLRNIDKIIEKFKK